MFFLVGEKGEYRELITSKILTWLAGKFPPFEDVYFLLEHGDFPAIPMLVVWSVTFLFRMFRDLMTSSGIFATSYD